MSARDKYEIVVGLEVHAQLATESKIFSTDSAKFGNTPNTNVTVITLAHPGTLPKLNKKVVDFAIKLGLACQCHITRHNVFARKNYFYPDLPKGYQLSQDKEPVCIGGIVSVELEDGTKKEIPLHHIHMEEDAGKSIHLEKETDTLIDLNRAGVPLLEIVSDPAMRSSEEAGAFLKEIRRLVQYLEICDGNMEEGSLRCDANVSVRLKGATKLGTRVEIKNMNSIRNAQRAIEVEADRQIALLEAGETFYQETRTYNATTNKTYGMREKENLNDYRYFPEPDLSPVLISDEWLNAIKEEMPMLPKQWLEKLMQTYRLSEYDAQVLIEDKNTVQYFEQVAQYSSNYKAIANWLNRDVKSWLNEHNLSMTAFPVSPQKLAELITLIDQNQINSSTAAKQLFPLLTRQPEDTPLEIAKAHDLLQENNSDILEKIIGEIILEFPQEVERFRKGKKNLQGMFMGQIMKRSKGKADPKVAGKLLIEALKTE